MNYLILSAAITALCVAVWQLNGRVGDLELEEIETLEDEIFYV